MQKIVLLLSFCFLVLACKTTKKEEAQSGVRPKSTEEQKEEVGTGQNQLTFKGNWTGDWTISQLGTYQRVQDSGATFKVGKDRSRISGFTSCNSYFGNMTLDAEKVKFSGVGGTEKACENQSMKVEQGIYTALNHAATFSFVTKDKIVFYDSSGALLMSMARLRG